VTARVRTGREGALRRAIDEESLGAGSIAAAEFLRNVNEARQRADGMVRWVEVCYCPTPLEEERPHWELFFDLLSVKDAHARARCRHERGDQRYACDSCDCTARLETRLGHTGKRFLTALREAAQPSSD
jgi:hypothetical protein